MWGNPPGPYPLPPNGIPTYTVTCMEDCGNGPGGVAFSGVVVNTSLGPWPAGFVQSSPPQVGDELANYHTPGTYSCTITNVVPFGPHNGGASLMAQYTGASPCGGSQSCTQQDFSWTSQCAVDWLDPAPGGQNSWSTWLNARWNGYNSVGCQHFQNIINWTTQQLASGVNANNQPLTTVQIARKQAKQDWAGCMQTQCNC